MRRLKRDQNMMKGTEQKGDFIGSNPIYVAREKPILTPAGNRPTCFLLLLLLSSYSMVAWRTYSSAGLSIKEPLFISRRDGLSLPTCEQMRSTLPLPRLSIPRRCFARLKTLAVYFATFSPCLFCLLTFEPHCFSLIYKDPNQMVILKC